jgi:NAD(P)-dependent dehydrogenase (short-subunit alcohol dehydrogenase family)
MAPPIRASIRTGGGRGAAAALYLASDDAHWNTGCCLPVDGGVSATI